MDYCLLAIGGDCSGSARSSNDYIPLDKSDMYLVGQYMRNQLERDIMFASANDCSEAMRKLYKSETCQHLFDEHHALGNALIAIGVFHHKWHKRTQWKLCAIELELHEFANASECPRKPDGYNAYGELAGTR